MGGGDLLWTISLRMCHALHNVMRSIERSISGRGARACSSHLKLVFCMVVIFDRVHTSDIASQRALERVQRHSAWKQSSHSIEHTGHKSLVSNPLVCLLLHVGREFVATRHAKLRSEGGTSVDHINFQQSRRLSGRELEPVEVLL